MDEWLRLIKIRGDAVLDIETHKLDNSLCVLCEGFAENPVVLPGCKHEFCKPCTEKYEGAEIADSADVSFLVWRERKHHANSLANSMSNLCHPFRWVCFESCSLAQAREGEYSLSEEYIQERHGFLGIPFKSQYAIHMASAFRCRQNFTKAPRRRQFWNRSLPGSKKLQARSLSYLHSGYQLQL